MHVTFYHNPRCSKSRQTLELLQTKTVDINVIEYLKTPPTQTQLIEILHKLNFTPRQLMRKTEALYSELNLSDETLTFEQLVDFMVQNPILIERPIVFTNEKAVIGRPPENVLLIL